MLSVHHIALGAHGAGLGAGAGAVTRAGLVTRRAKQLGVVSEALIVTLTAGIAHLPGVLSRALTLAIPLPRAAPLALPVAVADLAVGPHHVAGLAVGPEVVLGAAHFELVHTQPLPKLWSVNERVLISLTMPTFLSGDL